MAKQGRDIGARGWCGLQHRADEIAEGRVDIPSVRRTDTPDGQRAECWGRFRSRLTCTVVLALILFVLGLAVYAMVS